jgi:hypothetical protein
MAVRARATSSFTGPGRWPAVLRRPTPPKPPNDGRGARRGFEVIETETPRYRAISDAVNRCNPRAIGANSAGSSRAYGCPPLRVDHQVVTLDSIAEGYVPPT